MISVEGLCVEFNGSTLFKDVSFVINEKDRIAVMGKNGAGKSTLVKCIMSEIPYDGTLTLGHNVKIGYFAQNQASLLDEDRTVFPRWIGGKSL